MGLYLCKKHGRAGIVEACPHAADTISEGHYGQFHRIEFFGTLLVCQECLRNYDLANFKGLPSYFASELPDYDDAVEAFTEIYERLEGRRVFCSECVAAAEVTQARREGRPDPYPVYERTLTENHREILNELEAHLIDRVEFQFSKVNHAERRKAVFVHGGNYRQPVTVTIYYVTTTDDQDFIVLLVANFLAKFELNQAKAVFFAEEVWITWSNPEKGTSGGRRGEEKLLRETFINCA
jgi:hypothetical protein